MYIFAKKKFRDSLNILLLKNIILASTLLCFNIISAHKGGHKPKEQVPSIGVLKGTVLDSITLAPLQYASVSLIDLDHNELITGGLTDLNGTLHIKNIPLGQYIAIVEFIGYERKEISPINLYFGEESDILHDLGNIRLHISAVNMSTVDVLGEESQFIQTIDKKIFNVEKSLFISGGSGSDVLRKIPSVDVDIDGMVSIAGDANVTILIDGKKSGRTGSGRRGEVGRIDASFISRVEVITNPSAKYDPDGVGGIINIVLKRGAFDGFNGSISSFIGERQKQNINTNINYRNDYFNFLGSANYKRDPKVGDGLREFQYQFANRNEFITQQTNRSEIPNNLSLRLGADYYINPNSSMGYTLDIAQHRDLTEQEFDYILNTVDPDIIGAIQTTNHDDGFHIDHLLSYDGKFDQKNQTIKGYISFSHETDDVHEEEGGQGNFFNSSTSNQETNAFEDNSNFTISFDYENKFKNNLGFEVGAKAALRNFSTDLSYLNNEYMNDYSEDIYATYFIANHDFTNQIGLKYGLRAEKASTSAQLLGYSSPDTSNIITFIIDSSIAQSPFNNPYLKIYPSFFLIYRLNNNQTLQLGFSKKVNRPEREALSPFPESTQDISRLRNGNPYLEPEYSDVIEFNFSSNSRKINMSSSLAFKNTKNIIMWWDRDYLTYNSKDYEIITVANADKAQSINFSANIVYRPLQNTNIAFWGYGWNSRLSDKGESDFNGNSNGIGYGNRITINIPSLGRLEFSTIGRTKMNITTGTIPANFKSDLGIQRSFFNKKISVTIKMTDIFNSERFIINSQNTILNAETRENYQQFLYAERKADTRFTSIAVNYSFGKNKKTIQKTIKKSSKADMNMDY